MRKWVLVGVLVPRLAAAQVVYSTAPHPTPPPGFGPGLTQDGEFIAIGYGAAACGFRPEDWAQTLMQKIADPIVLRLKPGAQSDAILSYFGGEMAFGQGFNALGCETILQMGLGPLDAIEAGLVKP